MPTPADELQSAIVEALLGDEAIGEIVNGAVFDGARNPPVVPSIVIGGATLGREHFDGDGIEEERKTLWLVDLTLDTWRGDDGRLWPVRELSSHVIRVLDGARLELQTHHLIRIELSTPTQDMLDPTDRLTGHGIVTFEAEIEEAP